MSGRALFRWSAASALALHAALLLGSDGLRGGGDLTPHLRLIQRMADDPALRSVYAPAYHVIGALAAPVTGLGAYPEWFAWLSAAAFIAAFRRFQRAAALPDACSAVFAWAPYHFALSWCLPKIEVAGYAILLLGLACVLTRHRLAVAACVAAAFLFHTAAALLLGLTGGVLALASRDPRSLLALAAGTLVALPLPLAHVAAGCTFAQALLFSQYDYLRAAPSAHNLAQWDRILLLANPIALAAAFAGARALWRRQRPLALVFAAIVVVYLNELWLAPFGMRSTLDALRALTILAIPVAVCAGVAVDARPAAAQALVAASAILALAVTLWVVPAACVSKPIDLAGIAGFEVDRCMFRWRRVAGSGPGAEGGEVRPDPRVDRSAPREGAPQ
jgi:hypothetical protein